MALGEVYRDAPAADAKGFGDPDKAASDLQVLLTVDEIAALLKVSRNWVYEHTRSRGVPQSERLPHIKVGKYVRFDPDAVRAFLQRKCRTT